MDRYIVVIVSKHTGAVFNSVSSEDDIFYGDEGAAKAAALAHVWNSKHAWFATVVGLRSEQVDA